MFKPLRLVLSAPKDGPVSALRDFLFELQWMEIVQK